MNANPIAPAEARNEAAHRPQFHTREDASGANLQIALPGVRKEDLKLTLHESRLSIEARRHLEVPQNWKIHRDNATPQRYALDVRLTSRLDGTKTTASLDAGVLTLQVPVREEAKPRQIEVN